jgi:DNA repair exonuclease SbcCD ATPase subunit
MTTPEKDTPAELSQAALAFEAELQRFERLSEAVQKAPLRTEKNLEKAAQALQEVAQSDARLVHLAQALLQSFNHARERQVSYAGGVNARAEQIEARSRQLQGLMTRFAALGASAGELNRDVQALAGRKDDPEAPGHARALVDALGALQERMATVAGQLEGIVADAEKEEFPEVGRSAESLRQQMLAARNKMGLLQKSLQSAEGRGDDPDLPN